jgi:hypothetical protein
VGSWKPEPEKPRHVHAGNKRGPRRVERGRQWARRHNLCRTAQKRPAFPSRLTRGGPAGGVWARGHWWPSPTATCPRLRPGPVPHVSSLPPQERYGAGELLFLACRDDLPALLLSAPVVWFEFDAVVVLRVIGGLRFGSAGSGVGEKTAAKLLGPFGTGR